MTEAPTDPARWDAARAAAARLAETGVDPLDVQAAEAARAVLLRRFVLDLLMLVGIVAVVASGALLIVKGFQADDGSSGRLIWVASGALALLLVIVVLRTVLPRRAAAYEKAWRRLAEQVWPGSTAVDDMGAARVAFVKQAAAGGSGGFPATAPGSKRK